MRILQHSTPFRLSATRTVRVVERLPEAYRVVMLIDAVEGRFVAPVTPGDLTAAGHDAGQGMDTFVEDRDALTGPRSP